MAVLRWGIAAAGHICHDFTIAIKMAGSDHQVVAVAARKQESADAFAKMFDIPRAYEGYSCLAEDKEVDIVYVGSINAFHYEISKMMLNAGKHVLCEIPMTPSLQQTKELLQLAKERKRFLMEGFLTNFFPVHKRVQEEINAGTLGEVKHVQVSAGMVAPEYVTWINDIKLGGGSITVFGCFNILFSQMVFGERPERISASATLRGGIDVFTAATLYYKNGGTAQITCSHIYDLECCAFVTGTGGAMKVQTPFWAPTQLTTPSGTHDFPLPTAPRKMNYDNDEGLVYEIQCVGECIAKGEIECLLVTHDMTLMIAEIVDEIRRQIGVVHQV